MGARPSNALHDSTGSTDASITVLRQITAEQLLDLGKRRIAYLKMGQHDGKMLFVLFRADGEPIFAVDSIEQAAETTTELGLDLIAVH